MRKSPGATNFGATSQNLIQNPVTVQNLLQKHRLFYPEWQTDPVQFKRDLKTEAVFLAKVGTLGSSCSPPRHRTLKGENWLKKSKCVSLKLPLSTPLFKLDQVIFSNADSMSEIDTTFTSIRGERTWAIAIFRGF